MIDERLRRAADGVRAALSDVEPPPVEAIEHSQHQRFRGDRRAESRRGWIAVVGAAVAVLLLVGGIPWLLLGSTATPPTQDPVGTTLPTTKTIENTSTEDIVTTPPATVAPSASTDTSGWVRWPADPVVFGDAGVHDITAGGPGFVAVGFAHGYSCGAVDHDPSSNTCAPAAWTSPDGIDWSRVALGSYTGYTMHRVIASERGLVALGVQTLFEISPSVVWMSPDGTEWTVIDDLDLKGMMLAEVVNNGSRLIAIGFGGEDLGSAVFTSTDGRAWAEIYEDSEAGDMVALARTRFGLVAVGFATMRYKEVEIVGGTALVLAETITVWMSTDGGLTWHEQFIPMGDLKVYGVSAVVGNASGIVIGGTAIWYSPDGSKWTRIDLNELDAPRDCPGSEPLIVNDLAATEDGFVAVGHICRSAAAWTSADGLNWTLVTDDSDLFAESHMETIHPIEDGFVVFGTTLLYESFVPSTSVMWTYTPPQN